MGQLTIQLKSTETENNEQSRGKGTEVSNVKTKIEETKPKINFSLALKNKRKVSSAITKTIP